jgi:hypothetical protein
MKRIELIVSPEGETTLETKGFIGPSCREASEFLEKTLGRRTTEKRTAEFYQSQVARQGHNQRT